MFDPHSDYSLNKQDPDALICRSATGEPIRLTRVDFSSEEEFLRWKEWSDADYHAAEKAGRKYDDSRVSLIEGLDIHVPSAEEALLAPELEADRAQLRIDLLERVQACLTEKQYRRMRMYYLEGMTEAEIARSEGVGQPRICNSIASGKAAIEKFLQKFLRNRG